MLNCNICLSKLAIALKSEQICDYGNRCSLYPLLFSFQVGNSNSRLVDTALLDTRVKYEVREDNNRLNDNHGIIHDTGIKTIMYNSQH